MTLPRLKLLPFIFVRHGETFYNFEGRIAGSLDVPLTPKGEAQALTARRLLERLENPLVASSTLDRAMTTARIAMPGRELVTLPGLSERHWGPLEGEPIRDRMPYQEPMEGVEAWAPFLTRVVLAINEAQALAEGRPVVIFAHAGVFRAVRMATQGHLEGKRLPNASPVRLVPPLSEDETQWALEPMQPDDWV